jgi:2',3'-cyclic-nucleotide 2'-phosphodiesterase (5'-nucleotidase family)
MVLCFWGVADAAPVTVTLLVTTDLHGAVGTAIVPDGKTAGGDWLRLATLINQRRTPAGDPPALLIDCGDTTQGSLVAQTSRGQVAVDLLRFLRYDVWVPGNHEFDFGPDRAAAIFAQLRGPLLCANLALYPAGGGAPQPFPAWRLFERGGARIAVIGATAHYLDQWLGGDTTAALRAERLLPRLPALLAEIHAAKPDLIVLAIHQGWQLQDPRGINEVAAIAKQHPEIDLILGGHTHREIAGEKISPATWYVQPGFGAASLAVVRATVDPEQHRVLDITSELLPAAAAPPDPDAAKVAAPWLARAADTAARPAGALPRTAPAAGIPGETCAVSDLIARAMAEAVHADAAFHGKFADTGLNAGPVTWGDLFRILPYENTIAVTHLTPAELRRVIAEQLAWRGTPSGNGLWGVAARLDANGQPCELRTADGQPLPEDRRLRVAFNNYTLAGGGGRCPVLRELARQPASHTEWTQHSVRDALAQFLARPAPDWTPRPWLTATPRK